jgi:hypothetical protein
LGGQRQNIAPCDRQYYADSLGSEANKLIAIALWWVHH